MSSKTGKYRLLASLLTTVVILQIYLLTSVQNEQYRREAAISAFGLPSSPRPTKHENTEARKYINEMANDRARRKSYTKTQSVFPTTPKSEYSQVEEMHNLTFGRNSGATNIGKVKAPASVEDLYG